MRERERLAELAQADTSDPGVRLAISDYIAEEAILLKPYYEEKGQIIYLGDCFEILPLLEPVNLVLTDPPYGVELATWDMKLQPIEWLSLCRNLSKLVMFTSGNGSQYAYPVPDWTLCWFRQASSQHAAGGGFSWWEPILVYGTNPMSVDAREFAANHESQKTEHPCAKPLPLWKWLLSEASRDGETVLDPFLGSGTTLRACKDLGRRGIGIEINERYCEISAKRLSQEVLEF